MKSWWLLGCMSISITFLLCWARNVQVLHTGWSLVSKTLENIVMKSWIESDTFNLLTCSAFFQSHSHPQKNIPHFPWRKTPSSKLLCSEITRCWQPMEPGAFVGPFVSVADSCKPWRVQGVYHVDRPDWAEGSSSSRHRTLIPVCGTGRFEKGGVERGQ